MPTDLYDSADQVRVQRMISAGAITIAAYQVRDPETDRFGSLQFHMSCAEAAMSSLNENAAQLFVQFVQEMLSEKTGDA